MHQPLRRPAGAAPSIPRLYWSVKGEVACELHRPSPDEAEWKDDRWKRVPDMGMRKRDRYQCQHCAAGSPLRHPLARGNHRESVASDVHD